MAADTESGQSSPSSPLSSPPSSVLSSPLSSPANSPSPPPEMPPPRSHFRIHLPSPPSSQSTSQSGSPAPDGTDSSIMSDKDSPPPTKRRRISKERTTGYLDLRRREVDPEQQPALDRLLKVLTKSQKVVVIAGAGISVSAGSKTSPSPYAIYQFYNANNMSQSPISAPKKASSEASAKNTNSKDQANTSSTRQCTKMTRQLPPSTAWSARCRA